MRAGGWCGRGMLERPARGRYGASRVPSTIALVSPIRASLTRASRHSSSPRALPREPQQSGALRQS
ncbi:unnamed protein product, partial [Closterium sp. Naga37s-1]